MTLVRIAPVVEGDGEVEAVPILLRRLALRLNPQIHFEVARPFRQTSGSFLRAGGLERAIQAVAIRSPRHHILVLLDCDDGCAANVGPALLARAKSARPDLVISVVLCVREFECWLIAGAHGLRGKRGLSPNLAAPQDPEAIRGGKDWLTRNMPGSRAYSPSVDQAELTQHCDAAVLSSRSFRRLIKELRNAIASSGDSPTC